MGVEAKVWEKKYSTGDLSVIPNQRSDIYKFEVGRGPSRYEKVTRLGGPLSEPGEFRSPCSGFCPQSRRGTAPSENPAQDAERHKGERTQTPGSQGAERTRTPELTQTQRSFIRVRTMTPKHTLIYPQKQDAGRA